MDTATASSTSPWFDNVPDSRQYPRLDRVIDVDVAIVGGGMVGTIAAHALASSGRRVALVERNHLATGDTGYTTAFLTRVPDASAAELLRRYGSQFLRELFTATRGAQRYIRDLIERNAIACDFTPCRSFNGVYTADASPLDDEWRAVRRADEAVAMRTGGEVPADAAPFRAAIVFDDEARFHIRKFLSGLVAPFAPAVTVFEETEIQSMTVAGDRVTLETASGAIRSPLVIVAAGGPSAICAELGDLASTRLTFALAARFDAGVPFADHLFWDCDEPYQYFRRLDGATAIVGGADRDASSAATPSDPHAVLREFVAARLGSAARISHQWSGSLFETEDGLPYVSWHPHYDRHVIVATGFSGNGMVMGALGGKVAAALAMGREDAAQSLLQFARTDVKIPGPSARPTPPAPAASGGAGRVSAKVAAPKPGKAACAKVGKREVAVFNVDGRLCAVDNKCSHSGGPLCKGAVAGASVTCPWHGSKFNVTDGSVVAGPARTPIATFETRSSGTDVEILA
jgi:glycine/D-amino acid oxidase-like deaminating enzyme/nitrite reductase/ring-hydroxylating ferredoxin subunit